MRETTLTMQPRQWGERHRSSDVACPRCRESTLSVRYSCLATDFSCDACGRGFSLGELHRLVGSEEFEVLATLVQDRLSDRV